MHSTMSHDPKKYHPVPARNGLALVEKDERGFFLPDSDSKDELLRQPPLPLELEEAELKELTDPRRPAAFTDFGPQGQDKASNQDFALSALIPDTSGNQWIFAAVADGVSGKTFWPERSSRIACLVAYRVFRQHVREEGLDHSKPPTTLRTTLATKIRHLFEKDRDGILEYPDLLPSTFAKEQYEKRKSDDALWYNSTLLCAVLGPETGLILWAGDGGIHLVRQDEGTAHAPQESKILSCSKATAIDDFVSLAVGPGDFKGTIIRLDKTRPVSLFLSSDGFDRTLQRCSKSYRELVPPKNARSSTYAWLAKEHRELSTGNHPNIESDNSSFAHISWPVLATAPGSQWGLPESQELPKVAEPEEDAARKPTVCNSPIEDQGESPNGEDRDDSPPDGSIRDHPSPDPATADDEPAGRARDRHGMPALLGSQRVSEGPWKKPIYIMLMVSSGLLVFFLGRVTCREPRSRPQLFSEGEKEPAEPSREVVKGSLLGDGLASLRDLNPFETPTLHGGLQGPTSSLIGIPEIRDSEHPQYPSRGGEDGE